MLVGRGNPRSECLRWLSGCRRWAGCGPGGGSVRRPRRNEGTRSPTADRACRDHHSPARRRWSSLSRPPQPVSEATPPVARRWVRQPDSRVFALLRVRQGNLKRSASLTDRRSAERRAGYRVAAGGLAAVQRWAGSRSESTRSPTAGRACRDHRSPRWRRHFPSTARAPESLVHKGIPGTVRVSVVGAGIGPMTAIAHQPHPVTRVVAGVRDQLVRSRGCRCGRWTPPRPRH